jgi:antitoxin component of MazEF toxin-antitoxin module
MIKTLQKVGNSNALILDKPILELLGLEENGQVSLTIHEGTLIVTPAFPQFVDESLVQEKIEYILKKRKKVLEKLAK